MYAWNRSGRSCNLVLVETGAQLIAQFDDVRNILIHGQGRFGVERWIGLATTSLFPDYDDEVLFQFLVETQDTPCFASTRSAREEQQHGIIHALAADDQPLVHAAQFHFFQ